MNLKSLIAFVVMAVMASSCATSGFYTKSERRTVKMSPDIVRLDLDIDNFENLGSTEVSVISRSYFGIKRIDSVNNQFFNRRDVKIVELTGFSDLKLKQGVQKAAYKVVDEYPDADYYVVSRDYRKEQRLFLGKKVWRYVDIQAWKYKD
ncbi:hypothetical protein [Reichenbachiella versicolor]|uniref:hypothetical protein n=1 Tax=Reichenbachiella versicolor TaxID=1821036 RepID=UPI0013A57439|nr:hypothetical protein [Reichenbachiella versicolor]